MSPTRFRVTLSAALMAVLAFGAVATAQPPRAPLPLEPEGNRGEAIFPALEGWYRNDDGSFTIVMGYFNRNEHAVDVPIGPDNQIQPGGPDLGQPTHFLPRRGYGVFTIHVPADFEDQRLTWTLTTNNQRSDVSFWLNPPYFVDPFLNRANGNVPPTLTVSANGETRQGPAPNTVSASYTATVGEPLELYAAVSDIPLTNPPPPRRRRGEPPPPLTLTWHLYRGAGEVVFDSGHEEGQSNRHEFADLAGGETTTTATFSEPGRYRLIATANDISGNGGGGDQCCWTTAHVDVVVD